MTQQSAWVHRKDHDTLRDLPSSLRPEEANIVAVVPVQDKLRLSPTALKLLKNSITSLKQAKYVNNIYLLSSNSSLAEMLDVLWVDRGNIPSVDSLAIDALLQSALEAIESGEDFPEALLYINYDYLERPEGLFDELISDAQYEGYDTIFSGFADFGHYWFKNDADDYSQIDDSLNMRSKRQPVYKALYGLGCVTSATIIRQGKFVGGKVGILPIEHFRHTLRLKDSEANNKPKAFVKEDLLSLKKADNE